jgi:hypothetical protein
LLRGYLDPVHSVLILEIQVREFGAHPAGYQFNLG